MPYRPLLGMVVVFGGKCVIGSLGEGAINVSMSTISVALSERLAATQAKGNHGFVAASVFADRKRRSPLSYSLLSPARRVLSRLACLSSTRLGRRRFRSAISLKPRTWLSSAAISLLPR